MRNQRLFSDMVRSPQPIVCGIGLLLSAIVVNSATAQITPDQTLPTNSIVTTTDNTRSITGGTVRGPNLFHSFGEFSLPTGGTAYFNNAAEIQTILTRVTGNTPSNIDGLIRTNGTANFFFLNPNGITFGPNARLQIGGSFLATTADSFQFPDGSEFSATNPQAPPLLTVNVAPGLQTGPILPESTVTNRGNLTAGQDLTLEASQLDLQGQLVAGQDLTLKAQNTVQVRDTATTPFLAQSGRDLTIQGNQGIDILALQHPQTPFQSGRNLTLISDGVISGDAHFTSGGEFQVRSLSGQLATFTSLYDPIISSVDNVDIAAGYTGASLLIESQGSVRIQGAVSINAPDTVSNFIGDDAILRTQPGLIIRSGQTNLVYGGTNQGNFPVFTNGTIPAGITLDGASVQIASGVGRIVRLTANNGSITLSNSPIDVSTSIGTDGIQGSSIELLATDNIILNNSPLTALSSDIIDVTNTTPGGVIVDSDSVQAASNVIGGYVKLTTTNGGITLSNSPIDISVDSSSAINLVKRGSIELTSTDAISLDNSPLKSSFSELSGQEGQAGTITVSTVNGSILFDNNSSLVSEVSAGLAGRGGDIAVTATNGNITFRNNSYLASDSSVGSAGRSGDIAVTAINGNITFDNDSYLSSRSFSGDVGQSGDISVTAINGDITFTDSNLVSLSLLLALSGTRGTGGNITVTAINRTATKRNITFSNSDLISEAVSFVGPGGDGGDIAVMATNGDITFDRSDLMSLSFSGRGPAGNGGAINVFATQGNISGLQRSLLNSVAVSGAKVGSGNGGDIRLEAQTSINNLEILTQSSNGQAGEVQIHGFGDLSISNTQISTSQTVNIENPLQLGTVIFDIGQVGQSGAVTVTGVGNLTFNNTAIQSATQGSDPAGNVTISSPNLVTFANSQIISNTSSTGQAGDIGITAGQQIILTNGSQLSARTTSVGQAGDITLNAPLLTIAGNAQVLAETQGSGQGGSIIVNAPTSVDLRRVQDFAPVLSVETSGAGKAGNITVNTQSLNLSDTARITATATAASTNLEGGGSVTLNASNMNLAGTVGVFAETQGQAPAGTLRLNPYNNQADLNITLTPSSQISASTSGSGNGGDLILTAPQSITISGPGKLAVESRGTGNAGDIEVTTQQLTLTDGVELSASTIGGGNAGSVNVQANDVFLSGGARITSNTQSSGAAGDILLDIVDTLSLTDVGTGVFASTASGSTGAGGSITANSKLVQIENGATIAVDSQGSGIGGSISLRGDRLELNRRGAITAETASSQGGNITLDLRDLLLLRRNSLISTTAGTAQAGGDGGNITINAPFVIGVLSENSDIRANAFTGRGGNVTITTNGIYGLQFQPQLTPFSDITASSQFGLNGTVTLNILSIDPSRGLATLPLDLVDPASQIRDRCAPDSRVARGESRFTVTGRGGVPSSPDAVQTRYLDLDDLGPTRPTPPLSNAPQSIPPATPETAIVEAQGWMTDSAGNIVLVSRSPQAVPHRAVFSTVNCHSQSLNEMR